MNMHINRLLIDVQESSPKAFKIAKTPELPGALPPGSLSGLAPGPHQGPKTGPWTPPVMPRTRLVSLQQHQLVLFKTTGNFKILTKTLGYSIWNPYTCERFSLSLLCGGHTFLISKLSTSICCATCWFNLLHRVSWFHVEVSCGLIMWPVTAKGTLRPVLHHVIIPFKHLVAAYSS